LVCHSVLLGRREEALDVRDEVEALAADLLRDQVAEPGDEVFPVGVAVAVDLPVRLEVLDLVVGP
jgi:hypothetical protein